MLQEQAGAASFEQAKMEIPIYKKLIAAPFTPLGDDGEVNYPVIEKYVDVLLRQEVTNVFVNGTTGEGASLTTEERKRIAEKWVESGKGKLNNIIIHVGGTCLKDSQEMAKHAQTIGADAVACISPYFFRPSSVKVLVDYLAKVAQGAPNLPFLYYHIPEMTGLNFPMFHLVEEAVKRIPSFGGLKYTAHDLVDLGRCLDKYGKKYNFCYGKDEQFALALLLGSKSGVGSTYNFAGKIYSRIYEAVQKGDVKTATELQIVAQNMVGLFLDAGFDLGMNKTLMQTLTGLPLGPPRLPNCKPSDETISRITEKLKEKGVVELIK